MLFSPTRNKPDFSFDLNIGGSKLIQVNQTKFLGIIVDDRLNWNSHIHYVTSKLSKSIGILSRARRYLNEKILVTLYNSFIYPYLLYGNLIWGNVNKTKMWPLFRAQKRAIRLVFNLKKRMSTSKTFKTEKIIKVPDIYKYLTTIFMYKLHKNLLPEIFNVFFMRNITIHGYNTRRNQHLHVPIYKSTVGNRFITKVGVAIWNEVTEKCYDNFHLGVLKQITQLELVNKY